MQDKIACPLCSAPLDYFGEALMCSFTCSKCEFRMSTVLEDASEFKRFKSILLKQPEIPQAVVVQMATALDMVKEGAQFTILSCLGSERDSNGRLIMLAVYRAINAAQPFLPQPESKTK